MKKIILSTFLLSTVLPACAFIPDAAVIPTHDMQTLQQQRFRIEEINDYKEVQEEKERYWKKNSIPDIHSEKALPVENPEFTNENGEIKIKLYD